jgi:hypothetical protein
MCSLLCLFWEGCAIQLGKPLQPLMQPAGFPCEFALDVDYCVCAGYFLLNKRRITLLRLAMNRFHVSRSCCLDLSRRLKEVESPKSVMMTMRILMTLVVALSSRVTMLRTRHRSIQAMTLR